MSLEPERVVSGLAVALGMAIGFGFYLYERPKHDGPVEEPCQAIPYELGGRPPCVEVGPRLRIQGTE